MRSKRRPSFEFWRVCTSCLLAYRSISILDYACRKVGLLNVRDTESRAEEVREGEGGREGRRREGGAEGGGGRERAFDFFGKAGWAGGDED
jgi:hypothetical protein